jgi:hypothetical protein
MRNAACPNVRYVLEGWSKSNENIPLPTRAVNELRVKVLYSWIFEKR